MCAYFFSKNNTQLFDFGESLVCTVFVFSTHCKNQCVNEHHQWRIGIPAGGMGKVSGQNVTGDAGDWGVKLIREKDDVEFAL